MIDVKRLNNYLSGVDAQDEAIVQDGILGKIGGAIKGIVQGWKNAGKTQKPEEAGKKVKTIQEHDKIYHPNGLKEGEYCKFREQAKAKDKTDKLDAGASAGNAGGAGGHQIIGGTQSGKEAASSYLKLTKKPSLSFDDKIKRIAERLGPKATRSFKPGMSSEAIEQERQADIRKELDKIWFPESQLTDEQRKELGLSKPITMKKVDKEWKTDEDRAREHEEMKKSHLPDLPEELKLVKTPTDFVSHDGTGLWNTDWANSSHEPNGITKKKDVFNGYAAKSLNELRQKLTRIGKYSPQIMERARTSALRAAERFVRQNPKARSLDPMPDFQRAVDAEFNQAMYD